MKVKVLKNFIDKETGEFRIEGTEFECKLERAKELKNKGFVETLEPIAEKKEEKKTKKRSKTKKEIDVSIENK